MTIQQDSPTHARITFDVKNIGTVDVTRPFYINGCIGDRCAAKQVTLPVRAGGATEVFVDVTDQSTTTPQSVTVTVDLHNDILESRDDNNSSTLPDVSINF